ncbi:rod shape-determining protein MreC [Candidatus Parcubacteria bacterium]|nr:rod shape-determining protein MreC [Patescibacteria group bacterium]MCG2693816.1 rod shape-determining protein MreC [Candidatus Parcubacteria bacterium]
MLQIKGKTIIIAIAVFVLLIFLNFLKILDTPKKLIFSVFAPIQTKLYETGIKAREYFDNEKNTVYNSELELLKAQVRSLLIQNAKLKILGEENKILKKELGFTKEHSFDTVSARVIGADSLRNSTILILQIEDKDYDPKNLKPDMPVIVEDGILVGKIVEVNEREIFMVPITASRSAVAATILGNDFTIGVAEGESSLAIKMGMIPKNEKIKQGELVVTSGMEENMPKGLLLGTISKVDQDPQTPFNVAYVTPLYDIKRLSKVLIIKDY